MMNNLMAEETVLTEGMVEEINLQALPPDHDGITNMSELEVFQWTDSRNFNLLMVCAEAGRLESVNFLIQRGQNVNLEVNRETAGSLAFTNKHFKVVLALLKANSKFPRNYNYEEASDELKAFVALSTNLHDKIRNENQENLKEILTQNPSLRHHYDTNNNSALKIAIITAMFSMVEFLLNNNIILGPHEAMEDLVRHLTKIKRRQLRDLHLKLSKHIFSNTLMTFMRNCRFGPDDDGSNNPEYMNLVSKAFHFLLEIPSIAIILKIVAATRDFIVVFDFNREWTNYADPTSEPYTNGLFYLSGRIYIGAKNLLDSTLSIETYSVIAHELCHYAMFLVYKNMAKPYREKDNLGEQIFQQISNECKAQMESEEIIESVYEDYPPDMHHAELVVRAPQMTVLYHNRPELKQKRAIFPTFLDYFENVSVPALENALPAIEKAYRPKIEKKVKKLQNLIILLAFLLICLVPGAFLLYNPTVSYVELSFDEKMTFNNATVNFLGVDVKFRSLFANDSEVYDLLASEHLKRALKSDTTDLSKTIEAVYLPFIYLTWTNMTEGLKNKTFNSNVNFQGEKVPLNLVLSSDSALNLLSSNEIRDLLTNQTFNISKPVEIKAKFFVDRFFIDEDSKVDTEQFYKTEQLKSFDDVTKNISNKRVFLLSSLAGEGKSTTFRNFASKLKQKFPSKWVQFVNLKKYSKAFKNAGNLNNFNEVSRFLGSDVLKLENFEFKVFEDRFKTNEMIFFWDGIDEIAPLYKDLMLKLTSKIHKLTKNLQFISTRPQYSKDFRDNFDIKAHKLIPLGKSERLELLIKFWATNIFNLDVKVFKSSQKLSENFVTEIKNLNLNSNETLKFLDLVEKGKKIFESIETSDSKDRLVTNPLLIEMIAEIILDESFNPNSDLNIYQIFDTFVNKKLEIVRQKGEVVGKSIDKIIKSSSVNIMQVHQAIALKTIFSSHLEIYLSKSGYNISYFDAIKSITKLSSDEISRFGIVQVTSEGEFTFAHQTFAEFLVAQFFIDNMNEFDATNNDTKIRLHFFNAVLFTDKFNVVQSFLINYEKSEIEANKIFEIHQSLNAKYENLSKNENMFKYFLFMEFSNFFLVHFNIDFFNFLSFDPYSFYFNEFNELITNWDDYERVLGSESMKFALVGRDRYGQTLLHKIIKSSFVELFEPLLDKINKNLNKSEIKSLIIRADTLNRTTLMFAAMERNGHNVELFWKFIEEFLTKNEQKCFLTAENKFSVSALHFSTWNKDPNSFLFITKIYESFFTLNEIRVFFSIIDDGLLSFVYNVITDASFETVKEVAKYLAELFEGEQLKLREILSSRSSSGNTIFSLLKGEKDYEKKIEVFVELLRGTFEHNAGSKIEDFKLYLEEKLRFSQINLDKIEDFPQNLRKLRAFDWFNDDFKYFLTKSETIESQIGYNNMKILMLSKNEKNTGNFLHELMKNAYEKQVLGFLDLLSSTLTKTEIISLILSQDSFKNSPLMYAVKYQNSNVIKIYWKFIEQNLSNEEQKKFLLLENEHFLTALQVSAVGDSFEIIADIYGKLFKTEKIQEIILKLDTQNLPFVSDVMRFSSPEMCQNVADFLQNLFKDEKLKLQNFLSYRDASGDTIFTFLSLEEKKFQNQINIFGKLAKDTFKTEKSLENLKITPRFLNFSISESHRNVEFLRTEAWSSNDFRYFTENFEALRGNSSDENIKNLFSSQNHEGKSLLHELILNAEDEIFKPFMVKVELSLNKSEIFTFISMLDENLQSSYMMAAKYRNQKFLQNYFDALTRIFSINEVRSHLRGESKSFWTALQFSATNKNQNSFKFVSEIYGKFSNESEIREIILKVRSDELLFIYDAIEESSTENCREVADFLKDLFKDEKLDFRKLLSHLDEEGNSIFNKAENKQNLQIFVELLRETFDENEEEKFKKALDLLKLPNFLLKSSTSSEIVNEETLLADFSKILLNYREIRNILGREKLRNILMRKTAKNKTILHKISVSSVDISVNVFDESFKFFRSTLDPIDIKTLLFVQETDYYESALMYAARFRNEKDLKLIWKFTEIFLSENDQKKLLMVKQKASFTALQFSTWNKDPSSFLFMRKIYESFFTRSEIQEILSKTHDVYLPFIKIVIKEAILENAKEVAKYLAELFEGEKLKDILSHRDRDGNSIFSYFKDKKEYEDNFKVFVELLHGTFDDSEIYKFNELFYIQRRVF